MATIALTLQKFKDEIFDFENEKEWKYKGDIPAIVDFWAEWCQPCKMVAPIMENLSNKYEGKLKVYKVDTETERELSGMFGIRSIPSILFIPVEGTPMMQPGALPENVYDEIIAKELFKEGKEVKKADKEA